MLISVVHTYTVLYSKRVLQKDKKWEDGKLRFYQFNNKFEVISDDGMLVATDFYPSEKKFSKDGPPFEVGTTLVFPSGNLIVEFDDYVGVTSKDVTAAFTKPPVGARPVQPHVRLQALPSLSSCESGSYSKTVNGLLESQVKTSIPGTVGVKVEEFSKPELMSVLPIKLENKVESPKFANLSKWESRIRRFTKRIAPGSGRVSKLNSHRN